jgi:RNA polymerase sigma-32 factor
VEAEDWENATVGALQQALAGLDERSRDIIQSRWLAEDKATLHTLADRYGVSAERIRQLELGALKKLKGAIAA